MLDLGPEIRRKLIRSHEIGVILREIDLRAQIADDGTVLDDDRARAAAAALANTRAISAMPREVYGGDAPVWQERGLLLAMRATPTF